MFTILKHKAGLRELNQKNNIVQKVPAADSRARPGARRSETETNFINVVINVIKKSNKRIYNLL